MEGESRLARFQIFEPARLTVRCYCLHARACTHVHVRAYCSARIIKIITIFMMLTMTTQMMMMMMMMNDDTESDNGSVFLAHRVVVVVVVVVNMDSFLYIIATTTQRSGCPGVTLSGL